MLVIILPFLLAARVAVHEEHENSDWHRNGPECTYDVLVNMSLANILHESDNFCSMIGSELKCRPMGSDTLRCRFANGRIVRPDPHDRRCSNAQNFVPINDRFVDEDPFEIRFNPKGIENLVVSRNIPKWRLDMIRTIAGQLNVGFELDSSRDRFVIMENSSVGYCEVEVKMSRAGYGQENRPGDFEIDFEPERAGLVPLNRAALTIEKVRDPKNCPHRKIYFFGNHEDFSSGTKNTFMDMVTSISHMRVSPSELHSYTESTGMMRTLNRPRTMRIHQKISLTLKSISAARDSMPEVASPASTSLYAYTNLDTIPESK